MSTRAERTVWLGPAKVVYWQGPGDTWPYSVPSYVKRGGSEKYSISASGQIWRSGSKMPCGWSFSANAEIYPNQSGWPGYLVGSTSAAFSGNVAIGSGKPDCTPLISLDPSRVAALLEEARKTTTNQAVFDYQKLLAIGNQPGATIALSQLIEESYIQNLASATRNKIIEKFKSYQYIQDLQRAGLLT